MPFKRDRTVQPVLNFSQDDCLSRVLFPDHIQVNNSEGWGFFRFIMKRKILKIGFGFNNQYLQFSKGTLKTKLRKYKSYEPMKSRVSRIKQKKTLNFSAKTKIPCYTKTKGRSHKRSENMCAVGKTKGMNQ